MFSQIEKDPQGKGPVELSSLERALLFKGMMRSNVTETAPQTDWRELVQRDLRGFLDILRTKGVLLGSDATSQVKKNDSLSNTINQILASRSNGIMSEETLSRRGAAGISQRCMSWLDENWQTLTATNAQEVSLRHLKDALYLCGVCKTLYCPPLDFTQPEGRRPEFYQAGIVMFRAEGNLIECPFCRATK